MRLLFLLLFLAGLSMFSCKSKQAVLAPSTHTQDSIWEPTEKALLWQVDKKGFKTSYVYGTIHLIDSEDFFLPAGTEESLKKCKKIIYEISMDDMQDITAQMGMLTKAFMKDNVRISDLISEEDYELVADHFEKLGMPMVFLDRIKPMFLSILVGEDMNPNMLQNGNMMSYEMELDRIASGYNLEKGGLETIEYQMEIFDQIPYTDQADMLVESIKQVGTESTSMLDYYTEMYTTKDIKRMHDYTVNEEEGMEAYSDILLYTRNSNWIPLMINSMKAQPVFFAVGAGHLGGKRGVLALLKQEGFDVRPVMDEG